LPVLVAALGSLRSLVRTRRELALENLALRQQLAILRRASPKRLQLRSADKIFWALLSSVWAHWADVLVIVRPDTVVRWHRSGFRLLWRWKSRRQGPGRPPASKDIHDLIRRMATENLGWAHHASTASCSSLASTSLSVPCPGSCPVSTSLPRRPGGYSSPTTPGRLPASTSLPYPLPPSASSMSSWCFRSIDAGSCTGT